MVPFLKRNLPKIFVWVVGFAVIYAIQHFLEKQPDFIEEHDIITVRSVYSFVILLICHGLTSKKPIWKGITQEVEERIESCEKKINLYEPIDEKISTRINEKFEEVGMGRTFTSKIEYLEREIKRLSLRLSEHTWDCYDKSECQECGEVSDEVVMDSSGEGFCDKCHMPAYFKSVRQSWHFDSTKTNCRSKKQK